MAFEHKMGQDAWSFDATTGLRRYRFVSINSTGKLAYATAASHIDGVTMESSTGSTTPRALPIYPMGSIAMVEAEASTQALSNMVAVSTAGRCAVTTAGAYTVGKIVGGSSGAANRVLSVRLDNIGTT